MSRKKETEAQYDIMSNNNTTYIKVCAGKQS